jgi:two-component system OmpR family response regulator
MSTDAMEQERQLPKAGDARTLKVLVIDDEPDLADVVGALLSAHSIANRVVYSAAEGLRAIREDSEINAVFSDIMMPVMTGLQMARMIRDQHPRVNIVLTSGFTPPDIMAMHERFYLFTPKPYKIETVIQLLNRNFQVSPPRFM